MEDESFLYHNTGYQPEEKNRENSEAKSESPRIPRRMAFLTIISLGFFGIIVFLVYRQFTADPPQHTQENSVVDTSSSTVTWEVFEQGELGLTIEYPPTWELKDNIICLSANLLECSGNIEISHEPYVWQFSLDEEMSFPTDAVIPEFESTSSVVDRYDFLLNESSVVVRSQFETQESSPVWQGGNLYSRMGDSEQDLLILGFEHEVTGRFYILYDTVDDTPLAQSPDSPEYRGYIDIMNLITQSIFFNERR